MIEKTGICSITFRSLKPVELVDLVAKSGLDAIEWGGDVHVPPGELDVAREVRKLTEDAGLDVAAYGSYYKVVDPDGNPLQFEPVLQTALALGTDTIRIWAGDDPSDAIGSAKRSVIIEKVQQDLTAAQKTGVKLALEFHVNTLSDSNAAARELLAEINHPSLYTYWQPIYWLADPACRMNGLRELAPRVLNMHVFHWLFRPGLGTWGESTDRRPLAEGAEEWREFFQVPLNPEVTHYGLMEFVRENTPEQFLEDAEVLKALVGGPSKPARQVNPLRN